MESLDKLCDPKEGAERGRQVFMYTNLAMLTPAALGGAKTPGFNKTQGTGASKITDIMGKIKRGRNGWTTEKMSEVALIAIDSYFLDYKEGTFSIVEWLEEKLGDTFTADFDGDDDKVKVRFGDRVLVLSHHSMGTSED